MQQSSLTPMLISIAVFLSGLLLLLVRAVYDAAAGVGRARKEYRALLGSGFIAEAKENDRQLAKKLRDSGSRRRRQKEIPEEAAGGVRPSQTDSGPAPSGGEERSAGSPSAAQTAALDAPFPAPALSGNTVPRTSPGGVPRLNEALGDAVPRAFPGGAPRLNAGRGQNGPVTVPGPYPKTAELMPGPPARAPFLRERRDPR